MTSREVVHSPVVLNKVAEMFLAHIQDPGYNPEERRLRYLRERQLKGRRPAASKVTVSRRRKPAAVKKARPGKVSVARKSGANLGKAGKTRKAALARVKEIEGRLGALQGALKGLLAKKGEATSKAKDKPAAKKGASGGSDKPATAQEKSKQAKASKEHYEKNKDEILKKAKAEREDNPAEIDAKIKKVRGQIKNMQAELARAKAKVPRA